MDSNNQEQLDALLADVKSGKMVLLKKYYESFKQDFLRFGVRYGLSEDQVQDAYHDSIVALCENIHEGRLTSLQSSLKTYLFSIGKYSIINRLKKEHRNATYSDSVETEMLEPEHRFEELELTSHQLKLQRGLQQIGESCRTLLTMYYYNQYSIRELARLLNYKNENTVKAHKSRCMKKLRANVGIG